MRGRSFRKGGDFSRKKLGKGLSFALGLCEGRELSLAGEVFPERRGFLPEEAWQRTFLRARTLRRTGALPREGGLSGKAGLSYGGSLAKDFPSRSDSAKGGSSPTQGRSFRKGGDFSRKKLGEELSFALGLCEGRELSLAGEVFPGRREFLPEEAWQKTFLRALGRSPLTSPFGGGGPA